MMSDPDMNQAKNYPTNDSGVSSSTTTHQDSPHSSQLPTKQITILKRPENRSDLSKKDENKAESNCNAAAATPIDKSCELPSPTVVADGANAKLSQTESESRNNLISDSNTMADCDARHKFVTTVDEPNKLGKSTNEISSFASENANTASSMESQSTQKDHFNIGTTTSTNHPINAVNEKPEYTDKESLIKESKITDKALSSESDSCKSSTDPPKRKLPDLPADLGPLKVRCTSMSQEVLQLLSQKIKEDLLKTKDAKDVARSQQLRELSWKVTDMIALGSSAVKEFETKSAYQMQRERELKKYKKKNRKRNQPPIEDNGSRNINDKFHQNDQWRQNRGGQRGRRGNKHYNNRSNCHSASDKSWRMPKFNAKAAEKFANSLVKKIISQAVNQFIAEKEKLQIDKEVSMAIGLVNSIIGKSIQSLVVESAMAKNNLSLTEAELLCDMCEENISDEDSFLMNVEESISIKQEPGFGC